MPLVAMPRLSDSMDEGTIAQWLVPDGAELAKGDEFVEIETDKAIMAFEAEFAGPLRIIAAAGATIAVGAPIAEIGEGGAAPAPAAAASPALAEPEPQPEAPTPPQAPVAAITRVKASPLARRLAATNGVDLATLTGTGPGGRVVARDITAPGPQPAAFPLQTDVDMEQALGLLALFNEDRDEDDAHTIADIVDLARTAAERRHDITGTQLTAGPIERRPVVRGDAVVPGPCSTLVLSVDRGFASNAHAAAFLADVRALLEAPLRLTL